MATELSKEYTIRISDCDVSGRIRPSALLVDTQELAEEHSATLGLSRKDLIDKGICWILYRQHIAFERFPSFGTQVQLTTWPGAVEGPMFPRYFSLATMEGETVAEVASSWILMDIHTRRPMRPSALPGTVPANLQRTSPLPLPGMLRMQDATPVMERTVHYSDLDVNGHMNNTKYIDWICDTLDLRRLCEKGLAAFQINYISEAKPGEALVLLQKEEDGKVFVQGKRASDARPIFDSFVVFGE